MECFTTRRLRYEHYGMCSLFLVCEPLAGKRFGWQEYYLVILKELEHIF